MNKEQVTEGNKLISEFMGYKFVTIGYFGQPDETGWQIENREWMDKMDISNVGDYYVNVSKDTWFEAEDIQYHSSWDWLMPVVEKIESFWNPYYDNCIYNEHEFSAFEITNNYISIGTAGFKNDVRKEFYWHEEILLKEKSDQLKRHLVFQACIQFIQWYNQQPK